MRIRFPSCERTVRKGNSSIMNITTICMTVGEGWAEQTSPSFDPCRTLVVASGDPAFLEAQDQETEKHLLEVLLDPSLLSVMIMASDESLESELKELEAGAEAFPHKPVQEEALIAAVESAVGSVSEFPIANARQEF